MIEPTNNDMRIDLQDGYICKKEVDWSLLHQGLTIPVHLQLVFKSLLVGYERGVPRKVTIEIDGTPYDATLINQKFDQENFAGHSDVVQIRYNTKSALALKLRSFFDASYSYLLNVRIKATGKIYARLPVEKREYLFLYTTVRPDHFLAEAVSRQELNEANTALSKMVEEEFENYGTYARTDESATIVMRPQLVKVRKLDRSIGEDLKRLYDYRCQICGDNFAVKHEQRIVQVHHIKHFVQSMNNDYDNLVVICPNHHSLFHKANPTLNKRMRKLTYPNGYCESLVLDKHLSLKSGP